MTTRIERMGRWVKAGEAFEAWISGDLARMLAARTVRTNPIDRHFLLQSIVKATYRLRTDPKMRRLCIETGIMHLGEFSMIAPALRVELQGSLPRVPSFVWLATVLAEEGRVEEAVRFCKTAAGFGLEDGTKAGYLGRAERLARRKQKNRRDT